MPPIGLMSALEQSYFVKYPVRLSTEHHCHSDCVHHGQQLALLCVLLLYSLFSVRDLIPDLNPKRCRLRQKLLNNHIFVNPLSQIT